ncbi:N-acetylglucosamine-6-phosphate deacetylase [Tsukamurella strandjordii]|uniref:N-acetylglucosamine-6-phosphate deacetylase n=1 Tax=Tsukamurella TaxID=2060 RepID=UPI001C7DFA9F|nr:amidohydrolase family protein [Tsukamurella sp. TY48]GIZ96884.1 N-acetylglucosamine-6-phosphate deacetylase [Tsukamurella sp. TY48]
MAGDDVVLLADGVLHAGALERPGRIVVRDGRVIAIGSPPTGDGGDTRARPERVSGIIAAGLVDMHAHGGGGANVGDVDRDPAAPLRVRSAHLAHGVTTQMASLVTDTPDRLLSQVSALRDHVADGAFCGIHLEGPWLAVGRCGAHDPGLLRAPTRREVSALLDAARGTIAMVTLAPELDGALDAIAMLVDNGIRVAFGHTDATAEQTRAAIDAGATVATHLFNGMPPMHHRTPGPVAVALADSRVTVELILDGHHVARDAAEVSRVVAGGRLALISDAMSAAAARDGRYRLGPHEVDVRDGVARVVGGNGSLAGSTLTLDAALARFAREHPVDLVAAHASASLIPARALGHPEWGEVTVGGAADLIVMNEQAQVLRVMSRGEWCDTARLGE